MSYVRSIRRHPETSRPVVLKKHSSLDKRIETAHAGLIDLIGTDSTGTTRSRRRSRTPGAHQINLAIDVLDEIIQQRRTI